MSDAMINLLSLGITLLGLVASYGVARRRGIASGMRGAAWSMVPLAAAMTGVTEFVTDLAFSPVKWAGAVLAGLAVVLYMVSGVMLRRGVTDGGGQESVPERGSGRKAPKTPKAKKSRPAVEGPSGAPPAGAGLDPDLADIEEILKRRGIQ